MDEKTSGAALRYLMLFIFGVLAAGCDPALFKKPIQDFKDANQSLREAYFLQLGVARNIHVERYVIQRKLQLWRNANVVKDPVRVKEITDAIAKRESDNDLDRDWVRLRVKAFDTLDAYSGLLLALASDEDTDAITAEAKGLVADLQALLSAVKASEGLSKLKFSGGAEKALAWTAGLNVVVDAFSQIVGLISQVVRADAIRKTIVTADPAIAELLNLLGEEAAFAQKEARVQYAAAIEFLTAQLALQVVDDAARREMAEKLIQLQASSNRLQKQEELIQVFNAAREVQAALVRKAASPDYSDLLQHARAFKGRANAIKQSLEAIRNDR